MKQLLFLLLFPAYAMAQYPGNAGQKITLGEQTTADGLVWRGRTSDTSNLLTNKLDTSVYIVLDTGTRAMWYYRASTTPKWTRLVDSLNNLQGTLSVAKGGTGSATQNFVDLTTTQSIGGAKTFTSAVTATRFNPTANTATGTGMFLPAANTLGFSTNGTIKVQITSDGNVEIKGLSTGTYLQSLIYNTDTYLDIYSTLGGGKTKDINIYSSGSSGYGGNITLKAGGNVGIGTTSPTARLQVKGSGVTSSTTALKVDNSGNTNLLTVLDNGNVGIGVTPSAWSANWRAIQLSGGSIFNYLTSEIHLGQNFYYSTSAIANYQNNGFASDYWQYNGQHIWMTAPSGTAGSAISFTQAMTLASTGNLLIGQTGDEGYKLQVNGVSRSKGEALLGNFDNLTDFGQVGIYSTSSSWADGFGSLVLSSRSDASRPIIFTTYNGSSLGERFRIAGSGAATFSSSVTANGLYANAGNSARFYRSANDYYWSIHNDSNNFLNFGTFAANGTAYGTNPKMILLDNGNVGIGTSPVCRLDVRGTSSGAILDILQIQNESSTASSGSAILLKGYYNAARIAAVTQDASFDYSAYLAFQVNNPSNVMTERMRITSGGNVGIGTSPSSILELYQETPILTIRATNSSTPFGLEFKSGGLDAFIKSTPVNGLFNIASGRSAEWGGFITFTTDASEKMRITSNGEVWIGYTTDQGAYKLQVKDSLYVGGNVSASAYTTRSDYDLKDEIQNISYGINEVMQMQPVKYTYKSNGSTQLGFIAQDLGVITPEVVSFEDKMSVYYNALIPILTKAIQEQQALIKALEQRIINLENK